MKYLAVSVSEKMYFKVHFERMRVKITNVVGQMKRVLKDEWGMKKRADSVQEFVRYMCDVAAFPPERVCGASI